jgi:hypothetical protein
MFSLLTFTYAFLALLFSCLLYVTISALLDSLRSIPGPFLSRFTKLWYLHSISTADFEKANILLHRKHGPIVRIAPGQYSLDSPDAAKVIYGPGSHFRKANWYYGWAHPDPKRFTMFTDRNEKRHASERRKYSAAYSMSSLVGYEGFVDNCARVLGERFRQFAAKGEGKGEVVDLGHWMQCYAFDVIGEITVSMHLLSMVYCLACKLSFKGVFEDQEVLRAMISSPSQWIGVCWNHFTAHSREPVICNLQVSSLRGGRHLIEFARFLVSGFAEDDPDPAFEHGTGDLSPQRWTRLSGSQRHNPVQRQ